MIDQAEDLDLAEFVLGTLDEAESRRIFDAAERDPDLRRKIQEWELRLDPLDDHETRIEPSANLWSEIDRRLDGLEEPPESFTIRAQEGAWIDLMPGVEKKRLLFDEARGEESYLLRLAPGTTVPAHHHRLTEECLLLEGDFTIGDLTLAPGDFHAALADSEHPDISTSAGALIFIKGELRAA